MRTKCSSPADVFHTTFDENERILEEMVLEIGFFHPQYGAVVGRVVYMGAHLTAPLLRGRPSDELSPMGWDWKLRVPVLSV